MAQHMLTPPDVAFTDKRKAASNDDSSHLVGEVIFTANGAGTTTTIVGATSVDGVNAVRIGEKGYVFNSDGTLQEDVVVTVTDVTTGASDTVTFAPALTAATASGDTLRLVGNVAAYADNDSLDARLNAIDSTLYSQTNLDKMTQNDKVYALRVNDDAGSL